MNFTKAIIFFIGKILSYMYPLSVHKKIKNIMNGIINRTYSAWLSGSFKYFGHNSIITRPSLLIGEKYISIKENVFIEKNAVLCAWDNHGNQIFSPEISIGSNTCIGGYSHISAINKIIIGNDVLTGRWLTIVDNAHGTTEINMLNIAPTQRPLHSKGIVKIGNGVWIGDKVSIMAGVTVGNNSIIGANSVVTKSFSANSIIAGNPAKAIG